MIKISTSQAQSISGGAKSICRDYLIRTGAIVVLGGLALGAVVGAVALGYMLAKSPC